MSTTITRWGDMDAFSFGNTPQMADDLGALVVSGAKTATCWAAVHGDLTHAGRRMVMLDGAGRGWAVIETTELTHRRFDEVDAAFAVEEGEGSLDEWREIHRDYFSGEGVFAPDMLLCCERFRLVEVLERESTR